MQGLEKFKEYMSGFRSHYVVIGGRNGGTGTCFIFTAENQNEE